MSFPRGKALFKQPFMLAVGAFGLMGLLRLAPEGDQADAGLPLLRLGLALVGILALALAALPLLKRLPAGGRRDGGRMRCMEQLALDGKHRLALVNIDGRELLLGLQADGFILLKDLGDAHHAEDLQIQDLELPASEKLRSLLAERQKL